MSLSPAPDQPDQPDEQPAGQVLLTADQLPKVDPATGLPYVWAYANWGRWVADCAACPSAMQLERGQTSFVCGDELCRQPAVVIWPEQPGVIEQLLRERSNPANRNWHPWETAADLVAENVEHGVTPVEGL